MNANLNIKGIIFDKDGTLFNYAEIWSPIMSKALSSLFEELDIKKSEKNFIRFGQMLGFDNNGNIYKNGIIFKHTRVVRTAIKIIYFSLLNTVNPFKVFSLSMKKIKKESENGIVDELKKKDFSKLVEIFNKLKEQNIFIGIVTQDHDESAKLCLEAMGIYEYVSFLKTKDNSSKKKPHPATFNEFLNKFNLKADNVAFVGDALTDMKYAKRAKAVYVVSLLSGSGEKEKLAKRSDAQYSEISELITDPALFPEPSR